MKSAFSEIRVASRISGRLDEHLRQQVLRTAPLVCRDHMPVAIGRAHRLLEREEAARARIRLVAELHRGSLLLGKGRGAAVGEEIDEDILGAEQEGVVAGGLERAPPLRLRPERNRLDNFDLPRGYRHPQIVGGVAGGAHRETSDRRLGDY